MKIDVPKYKAQFEEMPEPLQKQIFIRLGFALAFLLLFILVLITMSDWLTVVPFIGISIYSAISAYLLFRRTAAGGYVVIQGICVETVGTLVRKRTKSIYLQTEEHMVQVFLRQRLKRIPKGAKLEIYVADNTQVYERDGAKLLHSYLAIQSIGEKWNGHKSERSVPEVEGN